MNGLSIGNDTAFRALFNAVPCACMIHRMILDERGDPIDYVPLEANPSFARALDFDPAPIIGKRATEYLPEAEVRHWASAFAPVALEGMPVSLPVYSPRKNATYRVTAISPERGFFITMFSIAGKKSESSSFADIARWTEGRMPASDFLKVMFETMPCAAAIHKIDRDGRGQPADYTVSDVNRAFCDFLDTTRAAMQGLRASARLRPAELAYWLDAFAPVAFGERSSNGITIFVRNGYASDGIVISPEYGYVLVIFADIRVSGRVRS